MSYTPTTWATGDTITATKLNKMENGIADSSSWDAVIRLTHSNDSGQDTPLNLTPSIVSGSFSRLSSIISGGGIPNVRAEYSHPYGILANLTPYIDYFSNNFISFTIAGYLPMNNQFGVIGLSLIWDSNDDIAWND